jgi:hypothetical protein
LRAESRVKEAREGLRTPRAAGVAGIVFAGLFMASLLLLRPPGDGSVIALAKWYSGDVLSTLVLVGLYTIPFAGIAFLWFIGVVRGRLERSQDLFFSTVFLGSGLLFVAMMFAAAACATAFALQLETQGPLTSADLGALRLARALTYAFLYVYAARAAGVFMITTSTIAWRDESMPRWVAIVGYAIAAVLLLSIESFRLIILLFPIWVALVSVIILIKPGVIAEPDD